MVAEDRRAFFKVSISLQSTLGMGLFFSLAEMQKYNEWNCIE